MSPAVAVVVILGGSCLAGMGMAWVLGWIAAALAAAVQGPTVERRKRAGLCPVCDLRWDGVKCEACGLNRSDVVRRVGL